MILLSFFKFVEDELDNRYYIKMKDCGLIILLLNLLYISFVMVVEVIYNFNLMSFILGYIIHYLLSLNTLLEYFEKVYNHNKHYFITLLSKVDTYITQFLNNRIKNNDDDDELSSNKSKEETYDLDEISNISITPVSSESDNDDQSFVDVEEHDEPILDEIEKHDESTLADVEEQDKSLETSNDLSVNNDEENKESVVSSSE